MLGSRCLLTKINDSDSDGRFLLADKRTRRSSTARHPDDQHSVCVWSSRSVGESEKEVRGGGQGERDGGR